MASSYSLERQDGAGGLGEVERERALVATQVIDVSHEGVRAADLVAEEQQPHAGKGEPELVARGVDSAIW